MAHEDLNREQQVEGSTDRSFGFVLGVFIVFVGFPLLQGEAVRWWAAGVAVVFALIALVKPALLAGLNRLWIELGVLLGKVISPIARCL